MRTVEQHISAAIEGVGLLPALDVTLAESRGCVLAEDVSSPTDWPHFSQCAEFGYAVRTADVSAGTPLTVIDEVPAGSSASAAIGPGKAIRCTQGLRCRVPQTLWPPMRWRPAILTAPCASEVRSAPGPV